MCNACGCGKKRRRNGLLIMREGGEALSASPPLARTRTQDNFSFRLLMVPRIVHLFSQGVTSWK